MASKQSDIVSQTAYRFFNIRVFDSAGYGPVKSLCNILGSLGKHTYIAQLASCLAQKHRFSPMRLNPMRLHDQFKVNFIIPVTVAKLHCYWPK